MVMAVMLDSNVALIEILCAFLGLTGCILIKVDSKQPQPYMDEIFHIPQAQKYCNGSFGEWDPMLTTPPGLYILSIGILKPFGWIFNLTSDESCSVFWLRSINVLFAVSSLYLLLLLMRKIHGQHAHYSEMRGLVTAGTLAFFPPLYFFTFLYYTDSGSTFLVLLMYVLSLHSSHRLAAVIGALSVTLRQTNIVWVVFVAGLHLARVVTALVRPDKKDLSDQEGGRFLSAAVQYARSRNVLRLAGSLLGSAWPYVAVGGLFATFVLLNGSIVLGAHTDHKAMLHFPQLYYLSVFTAAFAFPHLLSVHKVGGFLRLLYRHPLLVLLFCAVSVVVVYNFTHAHRYLLADNRHYTFYVWARVYRRHTLIKYALIPAYLFSMWTMLAALQAKHILWKCVYVLCVVVNLVPASLLEFRYFVLPYLIFRLNIPLSSYWRLGAELAVYITVNIVTLYVFMEKPFKWPGQTEEQRFMW